MNELYSIRMTGEMSLKHYGRLGMKWGRHIYGDELNNVHSLNKKRQPYGTKPKDYVIRKGQKYYRISHNPNEKTNALYVSKDPSKYIGYGNHLSQYSTTENIKVAGYKAIGKIYQKSQNVKIKDLRKWYKGGDYEDVLRYDSPSRERFIKEARKRGYDAIIDPNNSGIDVGDGEYAKSLGRNNAVIFINSDKLSKDYTYDIEQERKRK